MSDAPLSSARESGGHTPGKWVVLGDDEQAGGIPFIEISRGKFGPDFKSICGVTCTDTGDNINEAFVLTEEDRANATLIAAAPETAAERDRLKAVNTDLLEALERLLAETKEALLMVDTNTSDSFEDQPVITKARAAILKATGDAA